jgi:hypothetical protein
MGERGIRMSAAHRWGETGLNDKKLENSDPIRVGPPQIDSRGLTLTGGPRGDPGGSWQMGRVNFFLAILNALPP